MPGHDVVTYFLWRKCHIQLELVHLMGCHGLRFVVIMKHFDGSQREPGLLSERTHTINSALCLSLYLPAVYTRFHFKNIIFISSYFFPNKTPHFSTFTLFNVQSASDFSSCCEGSLGEHIIKSYIKTAIRESLERVIFFQEIKLKFQVASVGSSSMSNNLNEDIQISMDFCSLLLNAR